MKKTEQQAQDVLKALDKAIAEGPWDQSNFLKAIGKDLQKIREGLLNHLKGQETENEKHSAKPRSQATQKAGQQEVFISLYSADGRSIQAWERIITNLPHRMISRPIYAKEEEVKQALKAKENKENEAYLAIYVNVSDFLVLPEDKIPKDKLGNKLLAIKDRAIQLENIIRFVHHTGEYQFINGWLTKS